jgi:hypothetical protein
MRLRYRNGTGRVCVASRAMTAEAVSYVCMKESLLGQKQLYIGFERLLPVTKLCSARLCLRMKRGSRLSSEDRGFETHERLWDSFVVVSCAL